MISFAVADDHPVIAEGIRRYAAATPDLQLACSVRDVDELWPELERQTISVIVLDVDMPGMRGPSTIERLRAANVQVVIFTLQPADEYIARLITAGACAYVSKAEPMEALERAVRTVADGGTLVSEELARMASALAVEKPPHESLSERELEVFGALVAGKSHKEIAFELSLSASTVYKHSERVYSKLGLDSPLELHRYASRWRLAQKR